MPLDQKSYLFRLFEFIPIQIVLIFGRLLPFWLRGKMFGLLGKLIVSYLPKARNRVRKGLNTVFPDLSEKKINLITKEVGRNTALTLSELPMNDDYKKRKELISADGEGFEVLKKAKLNNRGAIVVSAHFGQWEAIRHHLAANDLQTGAVYRQNNPWRKPPSENCTYVALADIHQNPFFQSTDSFQRLGKKQSVLHIYQGGLDVS